MNLTPEELARIQRIVNPLVRKHRLELECPCAVWDSDDVGMILRKARKGVGRDADKRFVASASFVLKAKERMDEAAIASKARTAVDALLSEVLVSLREVKPQRKAA